VRHVHHRVVSVYLPSIVMHQLNPSIRNDCCIYVAPKGSLQFEVAGVLLSFDTY
jgi:hypothetical protein